MKSATVFLLALVALPSAAAYGLEEARRAGAAKRYRLRSGAAVGAQSEAHAHKRAHKASRKGNDDKDDDKDDDVDDDKEDDDEKEDDAKNQSPEQVVVTNQLAENKHLKEVQEKQRERMVAAAEAVITKREGHLNLTLARRSHVQKELDALNDPKDTNKKIDYDVQEVGAETQSEHLASFLGDMWKEMRTFATPFYKEHLEEVIPEFDMEVRDDSASLLQAKMDLALLKKQWRVQDKQEKEAEDARIDALWKKVEKDEKEKEEQKKH